MLHMYTHTVRSQLICACDRFLHTVMYSVDARDPERFWGLGGYISQLQGDVLLEVHLIRICSVHETSSVFSCAYSATRCTLYYLNDQAMCALYL
jgi:hypothetical protein